MKNPQKYLEKCQDELKVRIWYEGNSEALDKMLNKQKHSKDTRGAGYDVGECSTSKVVSNKEIQFVFSSGDNKAQTFIVRSAPRKKIDLTTTGEDMKMSK